MPKMHCGGTSLEIPTYGGICPRLKTNRVPADMKCEVTCSSGTPNVEHVICEKNGWTEPEIICTGTPTGLIVGLLVGGVIVLIIVAYGYAKWKANKTDKKEKAKSPGDNKAQPLTRAAKIAARNDMMVTGVVSQAAIKTGIAPQPQSEPTVRIVTGQGDDEYRHNSASSQFSNPPSYHSTDRNGERRERNKSSVSAHSTRSKRSRNSGSDHAGNQHSKHRAYYDEYTEDVKFENGGPKPVLEGQLYSVQDNGPMHPDYYGYDAYQENNRYGAMDQNYYARDIGSYPDHYLGGMENNAYQVHQGKPYHVPV